MKKDGNLSAFKNKSHVRVECRNVGIREKKRHDTHVVVIILIFLLLLLCAASREYKLLLGYIISFFPFGDPRKFQYIRCLLYIFADTDGWSLVNERQSQLDFLIFFPYIFLQFQADVHFKRK